MATQNEELVQRVEDENLKRLKKIRGGHRGKTTKLINEAFEFMRRYPDVQILDREIATKLLVIVKSLNEKKEYLEQLNNDILEKCTLDEIDDEVDESTDVSSRISESIVTINDYINSSVVLQKPTTNPSQRPASPLATISPPPGIFTPPQPTTDHEVPESPAAQSTSTNRRNQGVRLPKISLPRFNGDVTRFQHFWQSFRCAVDQQQDISDVHKLNYLVNSLEGQAYKALEGLEIRDENYVKATDLLKERFGKTQHIISAHMQSLLNLQSFQNDKISDPRVIYDTIMVHVRGLESLGVSSEKYGSLLVPVIISRMPEEIALEVARKTTENVWDIKDIMDIIRKEIEAREVSKKIIGQERKKSEKETKQQQRQFMPQATTKSFVTKLENSSKGKKQIRCYFCDKNHYTNECKEVTDVKQRRAILLAAKRCFNCLRVGHFSKDCNVKKKCFNCNGFHNSALCNKDEQETSPSSSITTSNVHEKTEVLLQTATAFAYGENRSNKVPVNILFDGGSQRSFVSEELKRKLALKSQKIETLNLNTFGSEKYIKKSSDRVTLNLEVRDEVVTITALSSPAVCSPLTSKVDVSSYPHLQGLTLADNVNASNKRIDLLIGADHYYDIVIGDVIRGSAGPVAISSRLGWLLSGPVSFSNENNVDSCNIDVVNANLVLDILPCREEVIDQSREIVESLDKFWKHEQMGLEHNEKPTQGRTMDIEFKKDDQRYEVNLPWKDNVYEELNDNYEMSKSRLFSLFRKLKENPELLRQYNDVFEQQLAEGIIEKVGIDNYKDSNAHFLCHFGVVRNDRQTTKLRVVFDGSAKSDTSLSLNDRLDSGVNHMPLLFDTIVRFQMHPVVLIADIEKAFLQVQINPNDRDVLRFLWFDDVTKDKPIVVQYRYCRLVFGLTCSPAILAETIKYHVSQFRSTYPEVVGHLNRLYCDDFSCGAGSAEEALVIYKRAKEIMSSGGFNLRKWNSNDKSVINEINKFENKGLESNKGALVVEDDQTYSKYSSTMSVSEDKLKVLGIGWVLRFVSNMKSAILKSDFNHEPTLTVSEVNEAENVLIKSIQNDCFAKEIHYLSLSESVRKGMKTPLYVNQFNLYLDKNEILRCRTRIGKSTVPDSNKQPILLPSRNRFSELIIADCHEGVFHNGTVDTLNLMRQRYWVLRGREQVKRLVRHCTVCKKLEGLPFKTVFNPDLPRFRVDEAPPFSNVGIDFAGPLLVKGKDKHEAVKTYVCLFTCAATRAVHLELVDSLNVETFIRAFRRFCARRGLPALLITDNAKTFKSASTEVKKLLRSPRLSEYFVLRGVKWRFIPELSPFQGGFWERLARSTKRCLNKVIGRAFLSHDELATILIEIEGVINSRPLTYVTDDSDGISYPLTPSQLINGRNLCSVPNDAYFDIVNTYEALSKRAKYNRRLLSQFTNRWKKEYLLSLLEKYKPRNNSMFNPDIKINDVCIIRNEQVKRAFWKLCKVEELLTGADGSTRAAKVSVISNDGNKKVLVRSLKHLIPLEIENSHLPLDKQSTNSAEPACALTQQPSNAASAQQQNASQATLQPTGRPKRNAAIIGELLRKDTQ